VKQWLDIAVNFKTSRNVKLFCGEFGVYIPNSPHVDRVYWYDVVRKYLEEKGISWTIWDYQGGFGLFEKGTNELFDYDLDTEILKSLNFNVPEQKEWVLIPETNPFSIYTDYIGQSVFESSYTGNGIIDFYSTTLPQAGKYSIYWTGSNRYAGPDFDLKPDKDMSKLVTANYELDFWVRSDSPGAKFEVRFVDSKSTVAGDHPWRISYTIDQTKVTWNGTWQHLKIPLKSFKETGSWDVTWYSPVGKFDWKAVDRLEFISEFGPLGTQKIWFDEIQINGTPLTSTEGKIGSYEFKATAYPNPMNESTTIQYDLPKQDFVNVSIYNLSGQKLATLVNGRETQGRHQIHWSPGQTDSSKLSTGVFICKITSSGKTGVLKLLVRK
jgi:endoglucanase